MIVRKVEICHACGQYDPWRKHSSDGRCGTSRVVNGERQMTVFCRRCGAREVVVWRARA